MISLLTNLLIVLFVIKYASGHARMIEPPSRASMWRKGFSTPPDYDDAQTWCGGLEKQKAQGGKCGICGDPFDEAQPRQHELGGKFGKGPIVRKYKKGQQVKIDIEVTANHKGTMEFKLCALEGEGKVEATQKCLNQNKLQLADGSGAVFKLTSPDNKIFTIPVLLPKDVTCKHCTLQWHWRGGNNAGHCKDGSQKNGCGDQETYRACADIAIS